MFRFRPGAADGEGTRGWVAEADPPAAGGLPFRETGFALAPRQQAMFRAAFAASVLLHAAALFLAPYLQPATARPGDVVTMALVDVPGDESPAIPATSGEMPPPRTVPQAAAPPPTRQAVRERLSRKGVLGILAQRARNAGAAGDPLSGIQVPANLPAASNAPPGEADFRREHATGPPPAAKERPGIGAQVAGSARSATTLASRVFRTDAGLEAEVQGGVGDRSRSPAEIASTVRRYQSGIKYAYDKELRVNSTLSGRIVVAFTILPDGSVASPEVRHSSVGWRALDEAVLRRMRHWKFPSSDGDAVRVTFPFVFHPEM